LISEKKHQSLSIFHFSFVIFHFVGRDGKMENEKWQMTNGK